MRKPKRPKGLPPLGPTGENTHRIDPSDKGMLRSAIYISEGFIILEFGTLLDWIALSPRGAVELADALMEKVEQMRDDL